MSQLKEWMYGGKISKLVVVITSKETGEHVERWQFDASAARLVWNACLTKYRCKYLARTLNPNHLKRLKIMRTQPQSMPTQSRHQDCMA